jgi:hypothetical protein
MRESRQAVLSVVSHGRKIPDYRWNQIFERHGFESIEARVEAAQLSAAERSNCGDARLMAQFVEKTPDALGLDRAIPDQESEILGEICALRGLHRSPPTPSPDSVWYP